MKKIFILFILAGILYSCTKLDENPSSFIVKEQFYKTQADAVSAVTAVYGSLIVDGTEQPMYGREINFLTDMTTDDLSAGPSAINPNVRALSSITYTATDDRLQVMWRQFYTGISRANVAIDNIPNIQMDTVIAHRLVRESKFLRALFYFDLVRLWGDVPLVLHDPTSLDLSSLKTNRSPAAEIGRAHV